MFSFFILLAVVNGGLLTLQWLTNAALGNHVGSLGSSFVNHFVGAMVGFLIVLLGFRTGTFDFQNIPWYYFAGGCLGVFVVYSINVAITHIGAMLTTLLFVTFQLLTSAVIYHYGFFEAKQIPLDSKRIIGLFFLFLGACIVLVKPRKELMKVNLSEIVERS